MTHYHLKVLGAVRAMTKLEPHHEKTCLRGFRPGKTQTGLLRYRDKLEILDLASIGIILPK